GRWRNHFPGRGGRASTYGAGTAPEGAAEPRSGESRWKAPDPGRYPGDRGDPPQPAEHDVGRELPRGPLVQAERLSDHRPAGAAEEGGCSCPDTPFPGGEEQGTGDSRPTLRSARGASAAYGVRMARKRARIGKPG